MHIDISEFIKNNRNQFDFIMDLLPIPIFVKDRTGCYIDCNKAFLDLLELSRDAIIGKTVHEMWHRKEADIFEVQDQELFREGNVQVYETQVTSSTGVNHLVQFHKQVFSDEAGEITGLIGVIFDVTEKKELEKTLIKLATIDELTGLPNRRDGLEKLNALHKASKLKEQPFCVAMLDLDNFKQINDLYGHNNGDIVLKEFSRFMMSALREEDICFRYGGEEFIVLLPETRLEEGVGIMERLRQSWSRYHISMSDYRLIRSTVSIGIVQRPINNISFEQLINESDKALYMAKNRGRNCTVLLNYLGNNNEGNS